MHAIESLTIFLCTLHGNKWRKSYISSHIVQGIMVELKDKLHIPTVFAPKKECSASVKRSLVGPQSLSRRPGLEKISCSYRKSNKDFSVAKAVR
jgi:hypothetical protein